MGPRVASTRLIGAALAVLCGLGASSSLADEAIAGDLGPIRQRVAQRDGLRGVADVKIGPVTALRSLFAGRNHAREGAIAGAVILGVMSGWYFGVMAGGGCAEMHPHESCEATTLGWAVAGAAGGALVGGAVGALIGSQFELNPTMPPASGPRTRVRLFPRRGGVGIAVSHSF